MAGFAIRTSFAGHTSNSVKAADELTYDLDHLVGAGQIDSIQGGNAQPYTTVDSLKSLYGVAEGNGGSIAIQQGDVTGDLLINGNGAVAVGSTTSLAAGQAITLIGHEQDIADTKYGTKSGFVTAGQGVNVAASEDIDSGTGAPGFTDTIHATPVYDGNGGNALIAQGVLSGNVTVESQTSATNVLATGSKGVANIYLGQQRSDTATTGQGGVQAGTQQRGQGNGGNAVISRGQVSGDLLVYTLSATGVVTAKTTSALGSNANIFGGQTVAYNIATGRSGYGVDVNATLSAALTTFIAQAAPATPGVATEATLRDAAVAIHTMENVVAALTYANSNAAHYSAADTATLATALTNATAALSAARTAYATAGTNAFSAVTGVQTAATSAKAALSLANGVVGNGNGHLAAASVGGSIVYTASNPIVAGTTANEGLVSGNITVHTPTTVGATGVVAVTASGGDGAGSLVELGHRYTIANTTGVGGGLDVGSTLDGGVAGNGGSITVSQSTTGDVLLTANRVVVTTSSGSAGPAAIHLSHAVALTDAAGMSDIGSNLGEGGAITATQSTTGAVTITANQLSSAATGSADGTLLATSGGAASDIRIGVEATSVQTSDSDPQTSGHGGADANRGGVISASQTVSSPVTVNLALNGTAHDLLIQATGTGESQVRVGALVTQAARSGNPVDDGSNVTASQMVGGDLTFSGLEDISVSNLGAANSNVLIGHNGAQTADSGDTNAASPLSPAFGGVTTATQAISGNIGITTSRSFTQTTSATSTGINRIGNVGTQTARSANQRLAQTALEYPLVAGVATLANFNVVSNQTVSGNLGITSGEIDITSQNTSGVQLGNIANITVDTDTKGRASSASNVLGVIGLTTVAPGASNDTTLSPSVNGDVLVEALTNAGSAHVGHISTSTVSHDPTSAQPTGTFVTAQTVGDTSNSANQAINVSALHNVVVSNSKGGSAQIGHTISETSGLSPTDKNAVKTSAADPSTLSQTVSSDINVTAGNSLGMTTNGGLAQIGHLSPNANQWQAADGGRVVTPQALNGNITVKVGINGNGIVVGEKPTSVAALGTNNALLDGSAGGTVQIGSIFASVKSGALNQTQTASGNIWVQVGAHLDVNTATVGHGPYDYAAAAVSTTNAVYGTGAVRNRIAGLTAVGAGQNNTAVQDATTEPDILWLKSASFNSGYGDNGGQLRFFIPSRNNLTIAMGGAVMNDSTSTSEALPVRTNTNDFIVSSAGTNHENYFLPMSQSARYVNIGTGNYAFYFGLAPTTSGSPRYISNTWDDPQQIGRYQTPCVSASGTGGIGGAQPRGLANASSYSLQAGPAGAGCSAASGTGARGGDAAAPRTAPFHWGFTFGQTTPWVAPVTSGTQQAGVVLPASVSAPVTSAQLTPVTRVQVATQAPVFGAAVPVAYQAPAAAGYGSRVLSFAMGGVNLSGAAR